MRIVVLVKDVPDTYGDRRLDLETGLADRAAGESVLDEIGERALEVALSYADAHPGTEVVAMTMAPEAAAVRLRKALAMGAASAVHIVDERLRGADLGLTARVLSAAIRRGGFDLVVTGNLSTDGVGGVLPAMIAEHLGVAHATALAAVELEESALTATRASDAGAATLAVELPAVISITEALPEPRYPNFKGIMAAKKKPVETLSLDDLGVDAEDFSVPWTILTEVAERPPRGAGIRIEAMGDDAPAAAERLVAFLSENRLV